MSILFYYNQAPSYHFSGEASDIVYAFSLPRDTSEIQQAVRAGFRTPIISNRIFENTLSSPHLFLHSPYPPTPLTEEEFEREMSITEHCIRTHCDTEKNQCGMYIQIDPETSEWMRKKSIVEHTMVTDERGEMKRHQVEVSGRFLLYHIGTAPERFLVKIDPESVEDGEKEEAKSMNTIGSFHTHPIEAYRAHRVCMAWPSIDDYITFLSIYSAGYGVFHIIGTVEGMYIITIGPALRKEGREKIKNNFAQYEKRINDVYHVDYPRCDINPSVLEGSMAQQTLSEKWRKKVSEYVDRMNRLKYFRVQFVFWEDAMDANHLPIWIEFKGVGQTCAVTDDQVKSILKVSKRRPRK